ncbi:MAG: sulfur carrier protein ThiS [Pseudomonadota bacterium]
MKLTVNGEAKIVSADNLSAVLTELGYGDATVATAVNGSFVPAASRTETRLTEGDQLEVLAPMQGG